VSRYRKPEETEGVTQEMNSQEERAAGAVGKSGPGGNLLQLI